MSLEKNKEELVEGGDIIQDEGQLDAVDGSFVDSEMENNEGEGQDDENGLNIIDYNRGMSATAKAMVFALVFLLVVGAGIGAFFGYQKGFFDKYKKQSEPSVASLTDVSQVVESDNPGLFPEEGVAGVKSPESKNESKKDEFKPDKKIEILVLNGAGVGGVAGKMQSLLEKNDYKSIEVGNANVSTYKGVEIYYEKDSMKKDAEEIKKIVEKSYSDVSVKLASSSEEKSSSVVVIVGK